MMLVKGWQTWWRKWSTWLISIGTSLVLAAPELTQAWQGLPPEIQAAFPADWVQMIGAVLVVSAIPAGMVRQQKLYATVHKRQTARRSRSPRASPEPVVPPAKPIIRGRRTKIDSNTDKP